MVGKYSSVNVLNQRSIIDDLEDVDAIAQVSAMINASGNRGQRRRLEKALSKTTKLSEKAQNKLDHSAYIEYQKAVDKNFLHFFAVLALVMGDDYHWKEDETHNQITSLMQRMEKKLQQMATQNYSTEDLIKLVDEKYDIILVPEGEDTNGTN